MRALHVLAVMFFCASPLLSAMGENAIYFLTGLFAALAVGAGDWIADCIIEHRRGRA